MSLKVLEIDDHELPIDVLDVEIPEINEMEEMELPDGFRGEEIKDQVETIQNLTSISLNLALEGIDQSTARDLDNYIPGFYQKHGGGRTFTSYRSIEGLSPALEAVEDEKKSTIARFVEWLKARLESAIDWIKGLVAKYQERNNSMKSINDFLANNRKEQIYDLLNFGTKTPEEAATEFVAKLGIGGEDLEVIKAGVAERFTKVAQEVERLRTSDINKNAYSAVLSGFANVSPIHISDLRKDLFTILKVCQESLNSINSGVAMNQQQLSELTSMIESFKSTHAMSLSALDGVIEIKTSQLSICDIKNNLDRVNKTFNADTTNDSTNALQVLMELMKKIDQAKNQSNAPAGTAEAIKPVAETVSLLVKFISMLNHISASSSVIGIRLMRAVASYSAAVNYVYEAAPEDSKKKVESFANMNGITLSKKQ